MIPSVVPGGSSAHVLGRSSFVSAIECSPFVIKMLIMFLAFRSEDVMAVEALFERGVQEYLVGIGNKLR